MIFKITRLKSVASMVGHLIRAVISRRSRAQPPRSLVQPGRVRLPSSESSVPSPRWIAADVMDEHCEFIDAGQTVGGLWPRAASRGARAFLVGTPTQLVGVVSCERLARAVEARIEAEPVCSLVDARLVHGHPDHPADVVLARLAASNGVLPIISREHAEQTVGVITTDHVLRFLRQRRGRVSAAPMASHLQTRFRDGDDGV
jgi:hypothetical protein